MKDFISGNKKSDMLIGGLAILSLLLCSEIFGNFMPGALVMMSAGLFVAIFALFAVLVWREHPRDEREAHIVMAADRLAFLAGSVALSAGVVIQTIRHESSVALVVPLVVMILTKLLGKYLQK